MEDTPVQKQNKNISNSDLLKELESMIADLDLQEKSQF